MLTTLRHWLRRLFGHDHEPPSQPAQNRSDSDPQERSHGYGQGPEDKPATDWTERYTRKNGSGDNVPERLRSLPAEQKAQHHENKGRGRTR